MKAGFIGAGKMAEAIISGLIEKRFVSPDEVLASDISGERLGTLSRQTGIRITLDNAEVVRESRICILAVKPQQLDAVVSQVAPEVTDEHLLVSIVAGKTTAHIESLLPQGKVIGVMPNIACLVGMGMNVFTRGGRATAEDADQVARLLSCCGKAIELPESQFDVVTALSGSGPAYFAWLLDRLVDGAVAEGLSREDALVLAEQTMAGTAKLMMERPMSPDELEKAVATPGGTTAAGLGILKAGDVAGPLARAVQAAASRSRELGRA